MMRTANPKLAELQLPLAWRRLKDKNGKSSYWTEAKFASTSLPKKRHPICDFTSTRHLPQPLPVIAYAIVQPMTNYGITSQIWSQNQ